MRVLIASNQTNKRLQLEAVFSGAGYNVMALGYEEKRDIPNYIGAHDEDYFSLIVGDGVFNREKVVRQIPARLIIANDVHGSGISDGFRTCALKTISHHDNEQVMLRKAALELGHAFGLSSQGIVQAGAFEINLLNRTAKVDGKDLPCTTVQFNILRTLAVHQGKRLSTKEWVRIFYDEKSTSQNEVKLLSTHVNQLNSTIEEVAGKGFKIRGLGSGFVGYCLPRKSSLQHIRAVQFGDIIFTPDLREIKCADKAEVLSSMESQFLEALSDKRFKAKELLNTEFGFGGDEVSLYASKIRKKMKAISGAHHIKTVWGEGIQLVDEPIFDKKPKAPDFKVV